MIEVFKTNVRHKETSMGIISILQEHFPGSRVNFDLEDCDKILRIEAEHLQPQEIELLVKKAGFVCEAL